MADLPRKTVTFLFTDFERSIALQERDCAAMALADDRYLALLRSNIEANRGLPFKSVGDEVLAAFPPAPGGIAAADAFALGRGGEVLRKRRAPAGSTPVGRVGDGSGRTRGRLGAGRPELRNAIEHRENDRD